MINLPPFFLIQITQNKSSPFTGLLKRHLRMIVSRLLRRTTIFVLSLYFRTHSCLIDCSDRILNIYHFILLRSFPVYIQ